MSRLARTEREGDDERRIGGMILVVCRIWKILSHKSRIPM